MFYHMLTKTFYSSLLILLVPLFSEGQIGGKRSFEFLHMPGNARVAALGGVNVSLFDDDVNLLMTNPAALQTEMSRQIALNHLFYYANINHSTLTYAHEIGKAGAFGFGIQYVNYGEFDSYDETGLGLGTFRANEYAITVSHSRKQGNFRIGSTLKMAVSNIGPYTSSALLADIGGLFLHPQKQLTVGLAFKNMGLPLQQYTEDSDINLPFDVQLGATYKPEFMPFRFSVTAYNLYQADIAYYDPAYQPYVNNEEPGTVDKVMRHITFGTELVLSKNFNLLAGYNHLVRRELRLEQASGGAGFSWGFNVRLKTFQFAYTKSYYHVAGGTNFLTLGYNFNNSLKKSKAL